VTSLSLTYFAKLTDPQGKRVRTTWSALLERLSVPRTSGAKHDVPGLSLATFKGDYRNLENVEQVFAIGLDLDEGVKWTEVRERFARTDSFVHSTWSSTLCEPRARVFLLLSRPVSGEEYRLVYANVAKHCEAEGLVVDRQASDPSRFWFLPAIRHGGSFIHYIGEGKPVPVEGVLAAAPASIPPPPPRPERPRTAYGGASAIDRAAKYLAAVPGAISGSGGHAHTFMVAQRMVKGFALTVDEAYALMANDWNPRCQPPWTERQLRRKCEEAARAGRMAEGELADRDRPR
jgi:hypothetical protein